ncbi:hypothetical protein NEUTE1DRAFT_127122 [Neurospora tetrasperma FGSC 2508]|uniref:Uncharacterized protein n=1 Tax=Neurospora tetrasperma (strain FGSC 2508 / ATCC MYA-4615 / P0657) TaxID=510951 RepID=F8MAX5_NEUT8|nr:uncharacterized protein NEUTE1DRAFT_127122 [Neurospora tetrasperma FGSC 2508]EGO60193.1 hypothetical protein NEUTE1DRAFT_127122 [Neurospora tetrasperma FGSC 2508]EGZ75848.1 hypothetical protein NEUTE2DRAFT_106155 [Neurospora tetrasperma FGSC 2509]
METPAMPMPKDEREQAILDKLSAIRDQLLLLKRDRTKYIRTQDVIVHYDQVVEQVKELNEIRKGEKVTETRVDRVLESCLQLLSLFFMTIGRTQEAPAAYALTSTIKRLLDHLTEADLYSAKDLNSIAHTLSQLDKIMTASNPSAHSPYIVELLANRLELCHSSLDNLKKRVDELQDPLQSMHERLISILRSMSLANTKAKFSASEVQRLQAQVKEIDESRVDGNFVGPDGQVLRGSERVSRLVDVCLRWSDIVLERKGVIPEAFKARHEQLVSIRNELEKLSITQAWSLRETDLYDYQRKLDKIDESRVDGNWLDDEGKPAELYVQRTLLYLIRRSYGYIYYLMISSEPVSEALLPIYNQLQTLKRCLIEVKDSGGVSSVRELYPYSMKLNSIDNMRVDGKFMVGGDIPEGQGSVSALLAECYDLSYELKVMAEEMEEKEKDSSS